MALALFCLLFQHTHTHASDKLTKKGQAKYAAFVRISPLYSLFFIFYFFKKKPKESQQTSKLLALLAPVHI